MGGTRPARGLCHRSPHFRSYYAILCSNVRVELYVTANYCSDSGADCCAWLSKMSGSACSLFSSGLSAGARSSFHTFPL